MQPQRFGRKARIGVSMESGLVRTVMNAVDVTLAEARQL
jgi:hypothetical protein